MKLPKTIVKNKHVMVTMQKTTRKEKLMAIIFIIIVIGLVAYFKMK